jgi:hypothetical protein
MKQIWNLSKIHLLTLSEIEEKRLSIVAHTLEER